ncbi:MAG: four-carbon acid sugar kinase family protein [Armatimonadota bacterium]|jgi:uncharacterized protein YgbK (DUF1537 family)
MIRLLVIADDLTGASETGAQFAEMGLVAEVSIDAERIAGPPADDVDICVVDTESRHISPERAELRVERLVRATRRDGIGRFYKKMDSTLRGNIGAELEALMRAAGARRLPFVPAYPAAGRSTRDGRQYVHGQPLAETEFARDPLAPVESSSIPDIIARQSSVRASVIGTNELDTLFEPTQPDECICVFDAETDDDLDRIAACLEKHDLLRCCAGAAGFAERVARRLAPTTRRSAPVATSGPVLFVNGSLQETALRQVRRGLEAGIESAQLEPEVVFSHDPHAAGSALIDSAYAQLQAGRDMLICTAVDPRDQERYLRRAQQHGVDDHCAAVAEALAAIAAAIARRWDGLGAITAFGGDTAVVLLRALGLTTLRPRRELWPGVIECASRLGGRDMAFITKSGGLGPEDLVPRLSRMYAGRES